MFNREANLKKWIRIKFPLHVIEQIHIQRRNNHTGGEETQKEKIKILSRPGG